MTFKDLIGKTIVEANHKKFLKHDDAPILELKFSDNTSYFIESYYGGFTGNSMDEYPSFIGISERYDSTYDNDILIDVE